MESELDEDHAAVDRHDELAALVAHVTQLHQALAGRDVIGQAKGILMERHLITAEEAFDLLVRESQNRNIKLREVAGQLVQTRRLEP